MRRFALLAAVIAISSTLTLPALAQAKDPFAPPPGVTGGDGSVTESGAPSGTTSRGEAPPIRPGASLPRTGLDYSLPVFLALGLMAAGTSFRLTASALAP